MCYVQENWQQMFWRFSFFSNFFIYPIPVIRCDLENESNRRKDSTEIGDKEGLDPRAAGRMPRHLLLGCKSLAGLSQLHNQAVIQFIGNSANVQAAAAPGGNSTSCHIAWGIGFMFAVFMANSVSGAHLNPAISLAQFVLGNFPGILFFKKDKENYIRRFYMFPI